MARERYLVGVSEEELRPDPPPPPPTPKGKWQNFWFYHKWHVVIGVAVLFVAGVLIGQAVSRSDPDYRLAIATDTYISDTAVAMLEQELSAVGKDLNGDGQVLVQVESLYISDGANQSQLEIANQTKLMAYLAASDPLFWAMTPSNYEGLLAETDNNDLFEVLDLQAAGVSEDGRYWNWKDSPLLQKEEMEGVPEDLYFGVRTVDADREKLVRTQEECMELLRAYITGVPLENAE